MSIKGKVGERIRELLTTRQENKRLKSVVGMVLKERELLSRTVAVLLDRVGGSVNVPYGAILKAGGVAFDRGEVDPETGAVMGFLVRVVPPEAGRPEIHFHPAAAPKLPTTEEYEAQEAADAADAQAMDEEEVEKG